MRHVCGHTNHRATMIYTCSKRSSDLDVRPGIRFFIFDNFSSELASKSSLYGYVMLTKGSIALTFAGKLLTLQATAMICTFLESPTDLDVHPWKRFALFGQNRQNFLDLPVRRAGTVLHLVPIAVHVFVYNQIGFLLLRKKFVECEKYVRLKESLDRLKSHFAR